MLLPRLALRYSIYFVLSAVALQVVFLIITLLAPGAIKPGYEIAALLPAAYFLGKSETMVPAALASIVIATLTLGLFAAQIYLQTRLMGIDLGMGRYPASSFAFLAGIIWVVAFGLGWVAFRAGQGVRPA